MTAPFDGIVTERYLHPGALWSDQERLRRTDCRGPADLLCACSCLSPKRMREACARHRVDLSPGVSGRTFTGRVARIDRALDPEDADHGRGLEVGNPRGELAPGMYPEVSWPVGASGQVLLVPPTSVVTTTERTFVIRVKTVARSGWT